MDTKRYGQAIMEKDELLIRAMVMLREINEIYQYPRVEALLALYDSLLKRGRDV